MSVPREGGCACGTVRYRLTSDPLFTHCCHCLNCTAARVLRRQLLARKPNDLGLVFTTPRGELLNDDNFRHRVFRPDVRRTKVMGFRFHDLRHTYAALMVAAGAHPKYLQAQMGHSSIRVTLDLYGHLFPDANRSVLVLAELDRLIDRELPEASATL